MTATAAHHAFNIDPLVTWIIVLWLLGFFGGAADYLRKLSKRHRKAVTARRQYQIELAKARSGLPYQDPPRRVPHGDIDQRPAGYDMALPSAVIPAPPEAAPLRGVPGECRHGKIVPVITADGELVKWICANWRRGCTAEFDKSVAVYDPEDGTPLEDANDE